VGDRARTTGSGDGFVNLICDALDIPPRALAAKLGVEYAELKLLMDTKAVMLAEVDMNETLWKLSAFVAEKLGVFMAVKEQLDRKLQADRANRIMRIKRMKGEV